MSTTFPFRLLPEIICSVFIVVVTLSTAAFLSAPKNTVAKAGTRVVLECRTNLTLSLRWSFYASKEPQRLNSIYNGQNVSRAFAPTYEVDTSPSNGRYNLIIKSADFSSAGEYICAEDPFNKNATVAFLTVIVSDPVCDTNVNSSINGTVENDELWAWCKVTYIGSGVPLMKWALDNIANISAGTVNSSGDVSTFTSKIKIQVNSRANGMILSCKTVFEQQRLHAKETLSYTFIWNYTINVLYGPRNLKITPMSTTFALSDSLVCSAVGNPSPNYRWTEVKTGRTISGSVLTLGESVVSDTEHTFQCTAVNEVAGQMKSTSLNITFNVTGNIDASSAALSQFDLLLPVVVPSTAALILMLTVGIFLVLRARVSAKESRRPPDGNLRHSETANQPTMQRVAEDQLYSEVEVNLSNAYVEPHEGLYAGLTTRPSRFQGFQEKTIYTPLRLNADAATNNYSDYENIV